MAPKQFPVEIFAVKEYGVDKWREDFFWPVPEEEFLSLSNKVEASYIDEINRQPQEIKTLLAIQDALIMDYTNFLHSLLVIHRIQSAGMEVMYSDKAYLYRAILEGGDRIDFYISRMELEKKAYSDVRTKTVKAFLKSITYNKNFKKFLCCIRNKENTKLLGSVRAIIKYYINTLPQWVYFTSARDWLPASMDFEIPKGLEDGIGKAVDSIVGKLDLIAARIGVDVKDSHLAYLNDITKDVLTDTARAISLIQKRVERYGRVHLINAKAYDPFSRAVSVVVQRAGGKVTSFVHGGDVGFLNLPFLLVSRFDVPFANDFITYTRKSAELYEGIKNNHSACKGNSLNILSGESREFFDLWRKNRNKEPPQEIKRIMITGYPHVQLRRPAMKGGFSLTRLDLELKLVDALKKAGYTVLYKAHPDTLRQVEGIFEDRADEVVKGYFQSQIDKADAFLFPTLTSSAFPIALCTNKPITILDLSFKVFEPFRDAMGLLKKRCSIVYTKFDERNRIVFDEKELLSTFAGKPGRPNMEFVETYLFPEKFRRFI